MRGESKIYLCSCYLSRPRFVQAKQELNQISPTWPKKKLLLIGPEDMKGILKGSGKSVKWIPVRDRLLWFKKTICLIHKVEKINFFHSVILDFGNFSCKSCHLSTWLSEIARFKAWQPIAKEQPVSGWLPPTRAVVMVFSIFDNSTSFFARVKN